MPMDPYIEAGSGTASRQGPLQACQPSHAAAHSPGQASKPSCIKVCEPRKKQAGADIAAAAATGLHESQNYASGDENADPAILHGCMTAASKGLHPVLHDCGLGQATKAINGMGTWDRDESIHKIPIEASSDEDLAAHEDPECSGRNSHS